MDNIILIVTAEFGARREMSANYMLESWAGHAAATSAILDAVANGSATFEAPMGLIIMRRA